MVSNTQVPVPLNGRYAAMKIKKVTRPIIWCPLLHRALLLVDMRSPWCSCFGGLIWWGLLWESKLLLLVCQVPTALPCCLLAHLAHHLWLTSLQQITLAQVFLLHYPLLHQLLHQAFLIVEVWLPFLFPLLHAWSLYIAVGCGPSGLGWLQYVHVCFI